jgi:YggT family protein
VVVGGLVLLYVLEFLGTLLQQISAGVTRPGVLPVILLSWAFKFVEVALIVRVISSWLPVSPFSKWVRWSFVLTNWIIQPLKRLIPPLGMVDITPIVAYLLLAWVLEPLLLSTFRRMLGT